MVKAPEDVLKAAGFEFLSADVNPNTLAGMLEALPAESEGLGPLDREMVKKAAVDALHENKISRASKLVDAAFKDANPVTKDRPELEDDPEPWPEEVCSSDLLDECREVFQRYLILPPGGAVAATLHCSQTHVHDAFDESAFLYFKSPTPECGKTRAMTVYSAMCFRPVTLSNTTKATLFRMIEAWHPTVLLDEVDRLLKNRDEELIALLNCGFNRHFAQVPRCVGDDHHGEFFSVWAPKVMAANGKLPETLVGRSITVPMKRKKPEEKLPRLLFTQLWEETPELRRKFRRFGEDNFASLRAADPIVPDQLGDREAEAWGPLLAIADLAGGDWPARARKAALILSGRSTANSDDSIGIELLIDLRQLVEGKEKMFSKDIAVDLAGLEGRPWSEYRHGKPITQTQLSRLLSPFDVHSKQIRIGSEKYRGYDFADLQDAFQRYIPPVSEVVQVVQPAPALDSSAVCQVVQENACTTSESGSNTRKQRDVPGVPDQKGGAGVKKGERDGPRHLF